MNIFDQSPGLLSSAALATALWASDAAACGGLFCSASAPVDQTAERIVFAQNPDDTVTAIIEIAYAGPSESFAWVLPIAGNPDVGISSQAAIDAISAVTEPSYLLDTIYDGTCDALPPEPDSLDDDGGDYDYGVADAGAAPEPEILVLSSGNVGPFDFVVIQANPDLEDKAEVALDWLAENDYDVTSLGPEVLRPYLDSGLNLVAFKLTKGNDAGSIRPVMLTYPGNQPSIPIRPTAVAARDDMGILVWVLGQQRAVPENFLMLTLNESRIDWFNWRRNYTALVTEAADEAGGQGFVTEYAGDSSIVRNRVFGAADETGWQTIEGLDLGGYDLLQRASDSYRLVEGFRDAVGAAVTLPEGVTLDEFGRNPDAYRDDPELVIDVDAFKEALFRFVIEPLMKSQEVFDSLPYLTRLYTTMSSNEMLADPLFTFNPDLDDVPNVHTAELLVHCSDEYYEFDAPWTLSLPNGERIEGGSLRQLPSELEDGPATSEIAQASASGATQTVLDNRAAIADLIASLPEVTLSPHDPDEPSADDDVDLEPLPADDDVAADDDDVVSMDGASDDDLAADDDVAADDDGVTSSDSDGGPRRASRNEARVADEGGWCAVSAPRRPSTAGPWALALLAVGFWRRQRR